MNSNLQIRNIEESNTIGFSPNEIEKIKENIYKNKIVVLKNQQMSEQEFCDFSAAMGEPVPYLQNNYHHPDFPLIFVSSNVKKDGKKMGVARTGGYWHSDTAFYKEPIALTMLYPQIIPNNSKRTTLFIDLEKALNEMPLELKKKIECQNFIHSGKWKYKVRKEDVGVDLSEILSMIHQVQPPVIHPAIITHPVTGKKSLFATRGFTVGIESMATDEATLLLEELFDFIEQEQFITEFQWQRGDIVLWDNRFLAHKAGRKDGFNQPNLGIDVKEEDTLVYRIIVRDGYPLTKMETGSTINKGELAC